MIRVHEFGDPALSRWYERRPTFDSGIVASVAQTIREISERGHAAVLEHTRRFDSASVDDILAPVVPVEIEDRFAHAIRTAIERVTEFHQVQLETMTEGWTPIGRGWGWRTFSDDERESGMVGQRMLPVRSAGIYVPGGQAEYPSSVVMNVVPAKVAGVERIVVCTPTNRSGEIPPAVMFACHELGVETVIKAGGASAIAALALGIQGVERVDVVAGPGNKYVNEAKRQLWGTVGLDGYAGPSEVCVVVDDSADAEFAAADLIAQVEHAPDNIGMLVALSREKCVAVLRTVEDRLIEEPRSNTIRQALSENGIAVVCADFMQAAEVVNRFGPEHLALHVAEPETLLALIENAGAVMMGPWTAQSVGDYCEGPSHTLPTSGSARFASPLSVATFLRMQTVTMLDRDDAADLATTARAIAELEGLPAHGRAAEIRTSGT